MNIFNECIIFHSSHHAEEQLQARGNTNKIKDISSEIVKLANEGTLLIEFDNFRYIKNGDYFLPCVQYKGKPSNHYRVKSVLTWDMVDYRMQTIINNYHESIKREVSR